MKPTLLVLAACMGTKKDGLSVVFLVAGEGLEPPASGL